MSSEEARQGFVYRPYVKSEFALLYTGATMSRRSALNWLNSEIASYPGLKELLESLGYHYRQRLLTVAQVHAIVDAIGEP